MEYDVEIQDSNKGGFILLLPANCDDIYHSGEFEWYINEMIRRYPEVHSQFVKCTKDYIAEHIHRFDIDEEEDE